MDKDFKGIDLDALEQGEIVTHSHSSSDLAIVPSVSFPLFSTKQNTSTQIDLTHLQLLYLIDISGSMKGPMPSNGGNKLDTVKETVRKFVQRHFVSFPKAAMSMWAFNLGTVQLCTRGAFAAVLAALARMEVCGGTCITTAVQDALYVMKQQLSPTKQNHLVVVSDGLDLKAAQVETFVEDMVANAIVFDFILITSGKNLGFWEAALVALKRTCERTGGQFVTVNDALTFEQKFLEASGKPCLPLPERSGQ